MAEFGSGGIMIKEKLMINCQVNFQLGYFLKNGETKILPWLLSLS